MDHAILVEGRRYRGITELLKSAFYGNYKRPVRCRRKGRSQSSRTQGQIVHRQLFHAFNCSKPSVVCRCRDLFGMRSPNLKRKPTNVRLFQELLRRQQLDYVEGELAVAWSDLNVATRIDAVVRHRITKHLYVVDFKTGYPAESRRNASTQYPLLDKGRMERLASLDNCPLNQHHLQVWFGIEALRRTWVHEQIADGMVAYFDSEGVSIDWHNRWRTQVAKNESSNALEYGLRAYLEEAKQAPTKKKMK